MDGGDLIVGSMITDRSLDIDVEDLMIEVMNLVLLAYKNLNNL